MKLSRYNEDTIVINFDLSPESNLKNAHAYYRMLSKSKGTKGILDVWSTYDAVALRVDPRFSSMERIERLLEELEPTPQPESTSIWEIPVNYDLEGQDLTAICEIKGLSPQEVVELHTNPTYQVAMIGFLPGFPYLAGLASALSMPRKTSPALSVPAGSVAIGGAHTGIYPFQSPGGWHIIGHTDRELFEKPDHFLLEPGDRLRFIAV